MLMLRYVTITGADHQTDPAEMFAISQAYPFVEWGLLQSYSKQDVPRYPSIETVKHIFKATNIRGVENLNFSFHLCGKLVLDFIHGEVNDHTDFIEDAVCAKSVRRVQLNFNASDTPVDFGKFIQFLKDYSQVQFIIQDNAANYQFVRDVLLARVHNLAVLQDRSLGTGQESTWHEHHGGCFYGYAGGLNPNNVLRRTLDTQRVQPHGPRWIDMESGVRTDDKLDMTKVKSVLSQLHQAGI